VQGPWLSRVSCQKNRMPVLRLPRNAAGSIFNSDLKPRRLAAGFAVVDSPLDTQRASVVR